MPTPMVPLNDGRSIPQIGLGSAFLPGFDTVALVRMAVEVGYRHIDTAKIYRNDGAVGEGVRTACVPRSELFVTSKVFCGDQGYDATLTNFDETMARMGLDYLDLYLIHWPNAHLGLYVDTWRAMIRLRDEGRIRSLGVSNFEPEHMDRLAAETGVVPVINQVELNPRFQQRALRAASAERGVVIESWGPLGHGLIMDDPVYAAIARKHGRSAAQIILRWHVQSGIVVIPRAERREWMEQNLAIRDFVLDDDDMAALNALDQGEAGRTGSHPSSTFEQRKADIAKMIAKIEQLTL